MLFLLAAAALTLSVSDASAASIIPDADPDVVCVSAITTALYFFDREPAAEQAKMTSLKDDWDFGMAFYLGSLTRNYAGNDLAEISKKSRAAFLALPTSAQTQLFKGCIADMHTRRDAAKAAMLQK
jgi:hypothetical protein